jgi:hypothetical protein
MKRSEYDGDRHKYVVGLNQLMGSHHSSLDKSIYIIPNSHHLVYACYEHVFVVHMCLYIVVYMCLQFTCVYSSHVFVVHMCLYVHLCL